MKILSSWPWPQGHPRGEDGADKNFRPISTIMPNMNGIHQKGLQNMRSYKLEHKNFDPVTERQMNERTYERTNVRMNKRMDVRKSENYIPPHTSYVRGIKMDEWTKESNMPSQLFQSWGS